MIILFQMIKREDFLVFVHATLITREDMKSFALRKFDI